MALHDRILRGEGGADVVSATLWPLEFSKELSSRRCAFFGRHHPGAPRAPRSGSRARRRFLSRAGCERKRLGPRFSRVAVPRASRRAGRAAGATPSALRRWSCAAGVEASAPRRPWQTAAGNYAKGLRGACKRVVAANGAAVKGVAKGSSWTEAVFFPLTRYESYSS